MSVKANRTVRIPLSVPDQRVDDLHATHNLYQYCQNRTVDWCWPDTPTHPDDLKTSKGDAEDALYDNLRDKTDNELHANLVQKAIKDAVSAVGSCKTSWENGDRISKPEFQNRADESYTMTYDKRAATYHRYKASFAVLDGNPVHCRYELPATLNATPYDQYVRDARWGFSTSKLVFDGEQFWLHAVMNRSYTDAPEYPPTADGSASFEAEPPASTSEGFRLVGSTTRVGRGGSRHGGKQATSLLPSASLSDTLFLGTTIVVSSDTVAQVAGITGRSSPAPEWWGCRPRRSFGTGGE